MTKTITFILLSEFVTSVRTMLHLFSSYLDHS